MARTSNGVAMEYALKGQLTLNRPAEASAQATDTDSDQQVLNDRQSVCPHEVRTSRG